mmetsp:Transcript_23881/g.56425  ORF Transcript_23881/g.56425 Transcript_23881/m.56425 type:complete len:204 (-) Transcript_23881:466-1077(-)
MVFFRSCQISGDAVTVFIICTKIASNIAPHIVWRGKESFSSCSVISGYFAFLIFCSIWYGIFDSTPSFPLIFNLSTNINVSQAFHHLSIDDKSPAYMFITVGRNTCPSPPSTLIVLVMRSGIEANRLLPSSGSFKKPETIFRFWKSSSQYDRTLTQPTPVSCLSNSVNICSVNTSFTGISLSPGLSKNCSMLIISFSYSGFAL